MNLIDEIVAASARPKRAFEWILEVRAEGAVYDALAEPGDDMATLDAKLSSGLAHIAPAEFQRTLQTKKIDAMKPTKLKPSAPEPVDWFWPFAVTGLGLLGLKVLSLFGLRFTPW